MREIKFRAWNPKKKVMVFENEDESADYLDGINQSDVQFVNNSFKHTDYIWLQFTGLKDKNGKEIYEGDIIRHTYYPAEQEHGTAKEIEIVSYVMDAFGFKRGEDNIPFRELTPIINGAAKELEILGNIYENPELLEDTPTHAYQGVR